MKSSSESLTVAEVLEAIKKTRGGVAKIYSAFSDFPAGMQAHFEFYSKIMLAENLPLSREEREFLAVEVSQANECPYCVGHHEEALKKYTKPNDPQDLSSPKNKRRQLLSVLATVMTKEPCKASVHHEQFLAAGFTEAEWQHAIMVVGYFNFSNRLAHSQSLKIETDFETTCG